MHFDVHDGGRLHERVWLVQEVLSEVRQLFLTHHTVVLTELFFRDAGLDLTDEHWKMENEQRQKILSSFREATARLTPSERLLVISDLLRFRAQQHIRDERR